MIWKPAAVRLANVKVKNVGSYFEAQQILSSPALNQVWRLRSYVAEKSIGAAKPLIFVKEKLVLPAGQCQRLM